METLAGRGIHWTAVGVEKSMPVLGHDVGVVIEGCIGFGVDVG